MKTKYILNCIIAFVCMIAMLACESNNNAIKPEKKFAKKTIKLSSANGEQFEMTYSSMEEAESELIDLFFPEGKTIDDLPFDPNVFDYDLFEQIVKSDASSMNYNFDSIQHYARIHIIDSPDGNVRYYTWDYPHTHAMSDFHTITQYRWNGKVFCQKPNNREDDWCVLSPDGLYVLKGNTCNYYLTTTYLRESSNVGYKHFEISKLTKKGLQAVKFWDDYYEYFISRWYFMTNGEWYKWLDYFDETTATLYVADADGMCLTDRYWCYQWNGCDMQIVGTETCANPYLHPTLWEYQNLELYRKTTRNIIRIDQMADSTYRYAAWRTGDMMADIPEIVIYDGVFSDDTFVFYNNGYEYHVNSDYVMVIKDGKTLGNWETF